MKKVEPPSKNLEVLLNLEYAFDKHGIDPKYFSTVLKYFYDSDLIEEEFLINWSQ